MAPSPIYSGKTVFYPIIKLEINKKKNQSFGTFCLTFCLIFKKLFIKALKTDGIKWTIIIPKYGQTVEFKKNYNYKENNPMTDLQWDPNII